MTNLFNWLAEHESGLSAIAATIAIIAGMAVVTRLLWIRLPDRVKSAAFLARPRNLAIIGVAVIGLVALLLFTADKSSTPQRSGSVARLTELTGKPSVAVLPLNYFSDDSSQSYLADGIAEDVITLLSRNPRFFVIARNSSFTYRGQAVDIRTVGEELGVHYVVEGSVRKVEHQLRVTVQLIDAGTGQHLWAEQYDRAEQDLFALQDEIANGITAALGDEIFLAEIARASNISTDNLDAWGLVMRANRSFAHFDRKTVTESVSLLREALEIDPDYTLARAELARFVCYKAVNLFGDDPYQDIAEAYALGEQALQQAPDDPLVLFAVGSCYGYTGRPQEAIRNLEKAVETQPYFASALAALGLVLTFEGRPEESLPKFERALQLSPRAPDIQLIETFRAAAFNELGRYAEAKQSAQTALKSHDGWYWSWIQFATAQAGLGEIAGAQEALRNARKKEPKFSLELVKGSAATLYRNKAKVLLSLLEPIWPPELVTATTTTATTGASDFRGRVKP